MPAQTASEAESETGAPEGADSKAGAQAARQKPAAAAQQVSDDQPSFWGRPAEINHARQFGLSLMPGSGYRVVIPYQDNTFCGDSSGNQGNRRVCTHALPFFLDLQLSFGIYARLDFIVDLRFALQKDPVTRDSHEFALAPGFRYWLDQGVALKFYATGQAVYDYVDYIGVKKGDFALRNADGLMYDPIKNVGFFFQIGWTMGLIRWFRMELDAGLGVQVRFP